MFNSIPAVELVGHADAPESALHDLSSAAPDLVLLHADPRKSGGLDLINYITRRYPRCEVIILSKIADMNSISDFLKAYADNPAGDRRPEFYINPEEPARIRACIEKAIRNRGRTASERGIVHPDGTAKYLYDYVDYIASEQHGHSYSGVIHGVTERRRKQTGRRHSEIEQMEAADRFQAFVEQLPGMPYIANLDKDGSNIYVSPRIEQLLGFTAEQWCKDPSLRIRQLHAEDRAKVLKAIADAIDTKGGFSIDYRIHKRDGMVRWLHDEATVVTNADGEPLFLQGAVIDITERRQAQSELERSHQELQELITTLDSLRVEEQKRLAHEMHDDLGQLLAAMKMDISTLRQHLPQSDSKVAQYLGNINELVDAMVASVRRIIADLPPKILEDAGLFSALEMMVANFEKRHQVSCHLMLSECEPELDTKVATAIYRMMQEMLNNVAKHARATQIEASVDCSRQHVKLCVTDNGRGMTTGGADKAGSFGLIGMRERVMALGGEMKIDSAKGKGTVVHITIPINRAEPPWHR
jgi:two-component system sensor histidine kinase UhpB